MFNKDDIVMWDKRLWVIKTPDADYSGITYYEGHGFELIKDNDKLTLVCHVENREDGE